MRAGLIGRPLRGDPLSPQREGAGDAERALVAAPLSLAGI
jgi:hypothetical protein